MRARSPQSGFSLIELMMVLVIFLIVSGAIFLLLNTAQVRGRAEQQQMEALQGARVAQELLTRDVNRAGYPALNGYDTGAAIVMNGTYPDDKRVAVPFTGLVGGAVNQACQVNSNCDIPGPFALVIEADTNPEDGNEQVEWIYYYLANPIRFDGTPEQYCTLYRAQTSKATGGTPLAAGTPLTEQVINRADGTCQPDATDPANAAIFTYTCAGGAATCAPENIQEVYMDLPVRPLHQDIQTGQYRAITLHTLARRLNPSR
jgi:prepilin-type N-terminal cleavage/methylation domain-containing protein